MNAKKRLLVTGANGFVAGSVLAQAGSEWELHAVSRGAGPQGGSRLSWHSVDIVQPGKWEGLFQQIRPDVIIHTAAAADIDFCQANPDIARTLNVELTQRLVNSCASSSARLVFCSTDTIFDGEHAPYSEESSPQAVNVYAETKIEAEQIVATLGTSGVIARLSLVMGLPVLGTGNSFLARMIAALSAGKAVGAPEIEVRTPIDVLTLGAALLELAGGAFHGIFHLAGLTKVNRLELNRTIASRFGFPLELIFAQPPSPGRAPRPRDVSLDVTKARATLKTPLLTLNDALSLILRNKQPATATSR